MDSRILKNSYIVAILVFIILCIIFYVFDIGSKTVVIDNKNVKKFSWKYPLALALIVWLIWYFYLFPPSNKITTNMNKQLSDQKIYSRINMDNWN